MLHDNTKMEVVKPRFYCFIFDSRVWNMAYVWNTGSINYCFPKECPSANFYFLFFP